jgi:glycosyltransferase involved in cell wall biosynthesis
MPARRLLFFADASSVHTRRWVGEMAARGHECHVATRLAGEVPGARSVRVIQPGLDGLGWFRALPQVRRLARQIAPDWVHGHYVTSYGLWAAACGVQPVALTAWGSDILVTPRQSRLMRALVGWTLRRAALVTADSADMLQAIAAYGVRAPLQQILWGADTDKFRPAAVPPAGFDIVSLRNWEPNYRIDAILQAFAGFIRHRPQAASTLHLLGGGPLEGALREQARQLGVEARVRFHGRVGDAQMVQALQGSRVSVTVPASDATSVSLLESMACGLAIVASDLPANRQWVDAAGGCLVGVGDVAALEAALIALHDDAPSLAAMGCHNRLRIEREASRRAQMDAMSALYDTVDAAAGRLAGRAA